MSNLSLVQTLKATSDSYQFFSLGVESGQVVKKKHSGLSQQTMNERGISGKKNWKNPPARHIFYVIDVTVISLPSTLGFKHNIPRHEIIHPRRIVMLTCLLRRFFNRAAQCHTVPASIMDKTTWVLQIHDDHIIESEEVRPIEPVQELLPLEPHEPID